MSPTSSPRSTATRGVSQGGALQNSFFSKITGNVSESSSGQLAGAGKLAGNVTADSALLASVDSSALAASSQAAALTPTQTLGMIAHSTTVTGDGGLNVIAINGNIRNSLILSGTSSDIFIVNVTGNVDLSGNETLGLSGGVTADHVLYNFTGHGGSINILVAVPWTARCSPCTTTSSWTAPSTARSSAAARRSFCCPAPRSIRIPSCASHWHRLDRPGTPGVTVILTGTDNQGNSVRVRRCVLRRGRVADQGPAAEIHHEIEGLQRQLAHKPFTAGRRRVRPAISDTRRGRRSRRPRAYRAVRRA